MIYTIVVSAVVLILLRLLLRQKVESIFMKLLTRKQRHDNSAIYNILEQMSTTNITRNTLPDSLRSRIYVINIPNFKHLKSQKEKCDTVLKRLCDKQAGLWKDTCRTDLIVFDVLEHIGAYFPSMHTDIEWNKVSNDGFQIWCLEYNKNSSKKGNMFIFENAHLEEKYKNTKYFLRMENNKILVVKNCLHSEKFIGTGVNKEYIMETMTPEQFKNTTKKYYLDFEEGDCMIFDSNILHMSDYRDTSKLRKSFNFRVALKDENGDLHLDPQGCGYVNSVSSTVKNPSKFTLVPN